MRPLSRLLYAAIGSLLALPSFASRPYPVDDAIATRLERGVQHGQKLRLERIPLIDGNPATLELERFEVWAPDAQFIVHEADGKHTRTLPRPRTRYYKGQVAGDRDSIVVVSVDEGGAIDGNVFMRDRVFSIGRGRARGETTAHNGDDATRWQLLIREIDPVHDLATNPQGHPWRCDVDQITLPSIRQAISAAAYAQNQPLHRVPKGTPATGAAYSLKLAIETDGELREWFASDAAEQTYLGNLIAKVSAIYQRDLNTTITAGPANVWASPLTDPYVCTPASCSTAQALSEVGYQWHYFNSAISRSAVVYISGKSFYSGSAWQDSLCVPDFYCGATGSQCGSAAFAGSWAGAYAFCGATTVSTTAPDPTLTVGGVQYGLPATDYWTLLEVAHEIGHLANGPHTHCIPLSSAQKSQYGVSRDYVDECFNGESGCFSGGTMSVPTEKGTIMSFCDNMLASGYPQSRYAFYKSGEPSELVLPYFQTGLNDGTLSLDATITVGSNLNCFQQTTASVPSGAASYLWTVDPAQATIVSGADTNVLTFTPTAASITLKVTVSSSGGCALINTKTTTSQCGGQTPPAPTGVVAGASSSTSVAVAWNASSGATSYDVYRSALLNNYTKIGSTSSTFYNDTTVSANASYLYKVRAVNGAGPSSDSNFDLATTVIFVDPTITVGSTLLKAVHINELRTAVGAVRTLAGLGLYGFTDPGVLSAGAVIKRVHVTEPRSALDAARSTLALSTISYTDPVITAGVTTAKAQHIYDLRNGVQ